MNMVRACCRGAAILIAVAGLVDPAFSVTRARPEVVTTVDLTVNGTADHRVPCDPANPCVIRADGSIDAEVPADLTKPLSLVRVENDGSPNLAIRSVASGSGTHAAAAGALRVSVEGRGVSGQRTAISVRDGHIVVGGAAIEWQDDATHTVDISWWPLAAGARTLRVEAAGVPGEAVAFDNAVDVGVDIDGTAFPVLVFDARPSWSSTFVRRALEDDPRFLVEHRVRIAPAISAGTAQGRLDSAALNTASVLIVGAPDALTAADVDLIERFVRVRGGTAMLLPERAPQGPSRRLFDGRWVEELIAEPRAIGPLRASELLRPQDPKPGSRPIAPEILSTRVGEGRIIISGAMDAWRHRDTDSAAFDTFWRSLSAEAAHRGQRLRVQFENPIARPSARQAFTIRYHAMNAEPTITAAAIMRCESGPAQAIRVWPTGISGAFRGELPVPDVRSCSVEATVNDAQTTAAIAVAAAPAPIAHVVLEKLARETRLRSVEAPARQTETVDATIHPLRSPWWILPFAGLLSIEWWLRRRAALR
jgi:hypothetical protein